MDVVQLSPHTQVTYADMERTCLTELCQLHELLRWRHDALRFDLTDETVGDAGVSIIEQLAYDELVQVLPVLQSRFGTIHDERPVIHNK